MKLLKTLFIGTSIFALAACGKPKYPTEEDGEKLLEHYNTSEVEKVAMYFNFGDDRNLKMIPIACDDMTVGFYAWAETGEEDYGSGDFQNFTSYHVGFTVDLKDVEYTVDGETGKTDVSLLINSDNYHSGMTIYSDGHLEGKNEKKLKVFAMFKGGMGLNGQSYMTIGTLPLNDNKQVTSFAITPNLKYGSFDFTDQIRRMFQDRLFKMYDAVSQYLTANNLPNIW